MVFTERQKSELKSLTNDSVQIAIKNAIMDQEFLSLLVDKIADKVSQKIKDTIDRMTTKISSLDSQVELLQKETDGLRVKLDDLEQQSKLNQLRIYGLSENNGLQLVAQVSQMCDLKLNLKDIMPVHCYRMGSYKNNKERAVIAVFDSLQQRNAVFQNKKKLRGTKIAIVEELTKPRHELLSLAKEKLGKNMVWTMGGRILTKHNNKKIWLKNESDVANLHG